MLFQGGNSVVDNIASQKVFFKGVKIQKMKDIGVKSNIRDVIWKWKSAGLIELLENGVISKINQTSPKASKKKNGK